MVAKDTIPLAGVIGDPVAHSLSPRLHGHWLARYGRPGFYIPMRVNQADLRQVLETLPKMGFAGINVTLPHKERVLSMARVVSDRAALIGAANTLTFGAKGEIQADNTDGIGFLASIREKLPGWHANAGPAIVLGAGGAAKAILWALLDDGAPVVHVVNRTRSRVEALQAQFGRRVQPVDWIALPQIVGEAGIIVNTTSLGMVGQPPLQVDLSRLAPPTVVADIVYTPLQTPLLREAAARGCETVEGIGMLLHQAVPGFERWFGKTPEVDDALRAAVLGT